MKSSKTSTEVIEVEAEEISLEKNIENALAKENVTEKVISQLGEKYGGLRLKSIDDKEGYLEIKSAKKEVRKWGILTEKICEAGRSEAVKIQKLWLGKQKEILAKIAVVEDPLQQEIDRYEAEQERKEQEEAQRKENAFMQRQSTLLKMGAQYLGGQLCLEDVSYSTEDIKNVDDEIWDAVILPKFDAVYQRIESARIAAEKKAAEEAEKIRLEREAIEKEKRELEEARELIRQQKEAQQKIIRDSRGEELRPYIMFIRNYNAMLDMEEDVYQKEFADIKIGAEQHWEYERQQEAKNREEEQKRAEQARVLAEEKRMQDEEKQRIATEQRLKEAAERAAQQERERIAREQKEAEEKRIAEEARKTEELAASNDTMKWDHYIEYIRNAPVLEMKSAKFKKKLAIAKEKIEEIIEL